MVNGSVQRWRAGPDTPESENFGPLIGHMPSVTPDSVRWLECEVTGERSKTRQSTYDTDRTQTRNPEGVRS